MTIVAVFFGRKRMRNHINSRKHLLGLGILFILLGVSIFGGKAFAQDDAQSLVNAPSVYTLVNLHPDQENRRLYSVNYQLPYLLSVCSEVTITKLKKKRMNFTDVKTGIEYEYNWHKKATPGGLNQNVLLYFGHECPAEEIKTLSEVDQAGIKRGRASEGMTRRGIIIAIGYPPEHVTPSLDMDQWMYWMNRFNRNALMFGEDGTVESIVN
jgi:hypothetical protein